MREYKFRGLDAVMGIWRYGSLDQHIWNENGWHAISLLRKDYREDGRYDKCWVKPETVGQYIGLTDENGKEIYEGDVLSIKLCNQEVFLEKYVIIFEDGCFLLYNETLGKSYHMATPFEMSVIGNVHDNPELLEQKNERA